MIMMNNIEDIMGSMIMLAITTDMDTTDQEDSTNHSNDYHYNPP